jgi:hypothetical protein
MPCYFALTQAEKVAPETHPLPDVFVLGVRDFDFFSEGSEGIKHRG